MWIVHIEIKALKVTLVNSALFFGFAADTKICSLFVLEYYVCSRKSHLLRSCCSWSYIVWFLAVEMVKSCHRSFTYEIHIPAMLHIWFREFCLNTVAQYNAHKHPSFLSQRWYALRVFIIALNTRSTNSFNFR